MQESCHLVALNKPLSQRFSLFIVRLSNLNHSHPLWCLECKPKIAPIIIPLPWAHFCFLFLLFEMWSTWSSLLWPSPSPWPSSSSITWIGLPYLIHTLRSKFSPRFHQLSKTKLGLFVRQIKTRRCNDVFPEVQIPLGSHASIVEVMSPLMVGL